MSEKPPQMGILTATAYTTGKIIGSGIFLSPIFILEAVGSVGATLVIWVACGCVAMIGALCYIELGTSIPRDGADYAYLLHVRALALAFGLSFNGILFINPGTIAIQAALFANYATKAVNYWVCVDDDGQASLQRLLGGLFIITIAYANTGQINKFLAKFQIVTTGFKLAMTCALIVGGVYHFATVENSGKIFDNLFDSNGVDVGIVPVVLSIYDGFYGGWDTMNNGLEELENPARSLPIVVVGSLLTVTVIYLLVNVSYLAVIGVPDMLASSVVADTFASHLFGRTIPLIVPIGIMIITVNSASSSFYASSRFLNAVGRQGHVPLWVSVRNSVNSPVVSILLTTIASLLLFMSGTVETVLKFVTATSFVGNVSSMIVLIYVRVKKVKVDPRAVRMPLILPIIFMIINTGLITIPIIKHALISSTGVIVMLIAAVIYASVDRWIIVPMKRLTRWNRATMELIQKLTNGTPTSATDFETSEAATKIVPKVERF